MLQRYLLALVFVSTSVWAKVPASVDVLIIGAGLSGLTTAHELKKADIDYHVLELTPRVGGRVRTVKYTVDGEEISADSGMEEYWESNPGIPIMKELGLPVIGDVAQSSMKIGGKLEPLRDEDMATFLSRILGRAGYVKLQGFKEKIAPLYRELKMGGALKPWALKLKDQSFAAWVKTQGLPEKVREWIRVSVECEAGTEWTKFSALDGIAEFHIFLGDGEKSIRVTGGNERFTDALARSVGTGNITLNHRVNRIVSEPGKGLASVFYLDQEKNVSGVVRARHVVSTIPLYRLFEVQFEPALSEKKRQAIQTQTWGAYFKSHVLLKSGAEKYWMKQGVTILPILSDSELGVIYDGAPEHEGKTRILSLLVSGAHAEAFNMMPLDTVRGTIRKGLEKLWPGIGREIKGIEFYRYHPRAIAAWPPGRSRFDALSVEVRRPENGVYLAGDFTESSHSDGAFSSALRVAAQIRNLEKRQPAREPDEERRGLARDPQ